MRSSRAVPWLFSLGLALGAAALVGNAWTGGVARRIRPGDPFGAPLLALASGGFLLTMAAVAIHQRARRAVERAHAPRAAADPLDQRVELDVFADYHQFTVGDERSEDDFGALWSEAAVRVGLAAGRTAVGVSTARNTHVPVVVEVRRGAPAEGDEREWERVAECGIEVPSGTLVVAGPTDAWAAAPRLLVPAGSYRARVHAGGFERVDEHGLEGEDRYRVVLWPGPPGPAVARRTPSP